MRTLLAIVTLLALGCEEEPASPPETGSSAPTLAQLNERRNAPVDPQTAASTVPVLSMAAASDPVPTTRMGGGGGGGVRARLREYNEYFDELSAEQTRDLANQIHQRVANARGQDICERLFNATVGLQGLVPDHVGNADMLDLPAEQSFLGSCRDLPPEVLSCAEQMIAQEEDLGPCVRRMRRAGRRTAATGQPESERNEHGVMRQTVMRRSVRHETVMRTSVMHETVMRTDVSMRARSVYH